MKVFIVVLLLAATAFGGWQIYSVWTGVKETDRPVESSPAAVVPTPETLPGMPAGLESSLQVAQKRGAAGLKEWLRLYSRAVADPRLASIELDYVVLVAKEDIAEARKVFAEVKERTPPNSPVYPRIQRLQKAYE